MGSSYLPNVVDNDNVGVIPRVLTDLFRRIEDSSKDTKFNVRVSFAEVKTFFFLIIKALFKEKAHHKYYLIYLRFTTKK